MRLRTLFLVAAAVAASALSAGDARAQGSAPGTTTGSAAILGLRQLPADLSEGGTLECNGLAVSAGVKRQLVPAFAAGLSARYERQEWPISPASAFAGAAPWHWLQRAGASLSLNVALSRTLLAGVSPTLEWAWADGAEDRDALAYGAVVSLANAFTPRFVLGGGANVSRQYYSVKATPFVVVNWKLTERLRIANAAPAGPLGGAGVELVHAPRPGWEVAGGGVYRSDRWRLATDSQGSRNVGETSSIPLLARFSNMAGPGLRLDLYAGVSTHNELTVRDDRGRKLARDDYGTVPLFSAMVTGRF